MKRISRFSMIALLGVTTFGAMPAYADGGRDWLNAPKDTNFFYIYYTHSNSETSVNAPLPAIDGTTVSAHVPILRLARTFDLGGQIAGFQVVMPYAFINFSLDGTRVERSRNGIGDVTGIFLWNFTGAPALSMQDFIKWQPETYLTGSISVTAPIGSYDSDRLINPGKNRWAFKPQLSWGTPVNETDWFTVNGNVELYTKNSNYFGGQTLKQSPLATIDAHYSRSLNRAMWVGADVTYTVGGNAEKNDISQENEQSTLRLGISGNMNFTPTDAVGLSLGTTTFKKSHTPSSQTISINYSKIF